MKVNLRKKNQEDLASLVRQLYLAGLGERILAIDKQSKHLGFEFVACTKDAIPSDLPAVLAPIMTAPSPQDSLRYISDLYKAQGPVETVRLLSDNVRIVSLSIIRAALQHIEPFSLDLLLDEQQHSLHIIADSAPSALFGLLDGLLKKADMLLASRLLDCLDNPILDQFVLNEAIPLSLLENESIAAHATLILAIADRSQSFSCMDLLLSKVFSVVEQNYHRIVCHEKFQFENMVYRVLLLGIERGNITNESGIRWIPAISAGFITNFKQKTIELLYQN